jgi:hypothetical protein
MLISTLISPCCTADCTCTACGLPVVLLPEGAVLGEVAACNRGCSGAAGVPWPCLLLSLLLLLPAAPSAGLLSTPLSPVVATACGLLFPLLSP